MSEDGFSPVLINFRNGFNAVAIAPADNLRDVLDSMRDIRSRDFCPEDVWILVNE